MMKENLKSPKNYKRKAKKRKLSDPAVNSITAYLSTSLSITTTNNSSPKNSSPTNSPSQKKKSTSPRTPRSRKNNQQNLGSPKVLEAFLIKGKENFESNDKIMAGVVVKFDEHRENMKNLNDATPKKQKTDVTKVNLDNLISRAIAESNKKLLTEDSDNSNSVIDKPNDTSKTINSEAPIPEYKEASPSQSKKKRGRPKKDRLSLKKTAEDQSELNLKKTSEDQSELSLKKTAVDQSESGSKMSGSNIETEEVRHCEVADIIDTEVVTPKQKNAFEFMMDSRHKSIGTNSPGKVRKSPESDKKVDRNHLSARKKLLESWANNKGGLKRKQDDIDRDEIISHKMEVRAKRLKRLLNGKATIKDEKKGEKKRKRISIINSDSESSRDSLCQGNIQNFMEVPNKNDEKEIQIYFSDENTKEEPVFKIKMFSPQVLKRKKRKTVDNHETETSPTTGNQQIETDQNIDSSNIIEISDEKTVNIHIKIDVHPKKRDGISTPKSTKSSKRPTAIDEIRRSKLRFSNSDYDTDTSGDGDVSNLRRSSRSAKKPLKYSDGLILSANEDSNDSTVIDLEEVEKKTKKNKKLAPIFAKATPKPKVDPAVIEARRKFLNSGIPNALKKIIEKEQSIDEYQFDVFPSTSHVQQRHTYSEDSLDYWNLEKPNLDIQSLMTSPLKLPEFERGSVSKCDGNSQSSILNPGPKITNFRRIIQEIKDKNPDYPVYKSFRLLSKKSSTIIPKADKKLTKRKKRGRKLEIEEASKVKTEKHEMWTDKYKPTCCEEILGNSKSVADLQDWLQSWLDVNDETKDAKSTNGYSSDSDFDGGDTRDGFRGLSNAVILTGPHGCGKTMAVYALCNEMGINVIESNASNKRTGKRLLQELQEATQSHQVRNKDPAGLSTFLQSKKEKSQTTDENTAKRKMCVLLVEDLDLVFEQDEGFLSALGQLLTTSKRPIILTTTDTTCTYLRKFVAQYPVIKFSRLSSRVLSVWLQIVCLLEGVNIDNGDLADLLDFYNGDVRRTLLQLQIFVQSGGSVFEDAPKNNSNTKVKLNNVGNVKDDDELSFYSVDEDFDGETQVKIHKNCVYNFLDRDCLANDLTLEKVWWNLPGFKDNADLAKACDLYDTISDIDVAYTKSNIFETERILERTAGVKDSLELKERFDHYSSKANFVKSWSNTLLEMSIDSYADIGTFNLTLPNTTQKRWLKKQKDCRDKFTDLVPLGCELDHRSYNLDYFPALRTISRSETERASNNVKRRNRFFNYLRSFDFHCSNAMTETACNILIGKEPKLS